LEPRNEDLVFLQDYFSLFLEGCELQSKFCFGATIQKKEFWRWIIAEDMATLWLIKLTSSAEEHTSQGSRWASRQPCNSNVASSDHHSYSRLTNAPAAGLSPLVSAVPANPELLVDRHTANIGHYLALFLSAMNTDRSTFWTDNPSSSRFLWRSFLRFFWQIESNLQTCVS